MSGQRDCALSKQRKKQPNPIAAGAAQAGRTIADFDLQVAAGVVAFSDDVESLIAPANRVSPSEKEGRSYRSLLARRRDFPRRLLR